MVIFYKKWKKSNEIQLTKNKMDLNIRKMTNHPPSPGTKCKMDWNNRKMKKKKIIRPPPLVTQGIIMAWEYITM